MAATDTYLFGRKTYEKMAAYWPTAIACTENATEREFLRRRRQALTQA